jgi:hypothetical protein
MTPISPRFEIRRLNYGETPDAKTDFKIFAGTKIMPPDTSYLTLGQWPHYRISLITPDPQQEQTVSKYPDQTPNIQDMACAAKEPKETGASEVDPGEGWRLLRLGDIIEPADWCQPFGLADSDWRPLHEASESIGNAWHPDLHFPMRRRIPAPQPAAEQAPTVDIVRHEREELRKANEALLERCNWLERDGHDWETFAKEYRAERDQLAARCKELEQTNVELESDWHLLVIECDNRKAELATAQAELAKLQGAAKGDEEWRELTKHDQYSGPGQVRDDDDAEWEDCEIQIINPKEEHPFLIFRDEYKEDYFAYRFARVRTTSGKGESL